jgi:hypothetical protein
MRAYPTTEVAMVPVRWRRALAAVLLAVLPAWPGAALADAVTEWNVIAIDATAVPPNSILQSRVLAIVHGAVYDAVTAVTRRGAAWAVAIEAPLGASPDAAVAAAAHGVLVRLASGQRPMLDAALAASLSKIPDGPGKTDGVRIGAQIAERIVAQRAADGSDVKVVFTPRPGAGRYQLTPPLSLPAILPQWGGVAPFVLRSRTGLEPKGPPAVGSAQFARDLDEVKRLGGRDSRARTADQTAAAIFWLVQTAVPWHAAARAASASRKLSLPENARLFAILSMATADSQIVCFDEKYKRPHWRPITAIRAAADPGDPSPQGDGAWQPLLGTPPHPEYPSAHATFSGAAEAALRGFFGSDDVDVSVTFPPGLGITRTFRRFSQISEEVNNARVWAGIHFRSADRDGSELGRRIGEIVVRDFPNPAAAAAM